MLEELKKVVYEANCELPSRGLVVYTWGNVSGIDRSKGFIVIKPSGVSYEDMKPSDMVVVDLSGNVVEGGLKPSSDTPTHLELYKAFPFVGGIVHTHSSYVTIWAQAGRGIPCLGTTHADYFFGEIPCTRMLKGDEIRGEYEAETGKVIIETFREREIDPSYIPAVVVYGHGPFVWGRSPEEAVHNSVVLEETAKTAMFTSLLNPDIQPLARALQDKHFLRKHGPDAYYGQK
ncbi:MAG: L-ribulose-5-phosphate 4-epimerase [Clostridiales bacterium]|nr:L-ribulose-5-phosphate 4-epimerase [Clostridiales bacterium]